MERRLTKQEQETIIVFNRADKTADVFTHDKNWQHCLEHKLGFKPTRVERFTGRNYVIPKSHIPMPRRPRQLSPATKKKLAEQARKMTANRKPEK
jgi:hypothetical protein